MSDKTSFGKPWYDKERDGSLADYIGSIDSGTFALFLGKEMYEQLWDEGFLQPDISAIRVMWNIGRGDEHYFVKSRTQVEGIPHDMHGGKPGVHNIEEILNDEAPPFEAHQLDPNPKPRK